MLASDLPAESEAGLLKICSKMGISTLSSYRGGQIFEIVGLDGSLVERAFCGTPCRIGGVGLRQLGEEVLRRHGEAFTDTSPRLRHYGFVGFRGDGCGWSSRMPGLPLLEKRRPESSVSRILSDGPWATVRSFL